MVNRNMLLSVTVIAILALSAAGAWAGEDTDDAMGIAEAKDTLTDMNSKPLMKFSDMGMAGVEIDYVFPQPGVSTKKVDGTTYQYLHIDGFGKLGEVGKPALPMRNYIVAVPIGGDVRIEMLETESEIVDSYPIYPALEPAMDTAGAPNPEFVIDEEFYNSNQNYPVEPVQVVAINKLRGISLAHVQICPVQYNPKLKQSTVYSRLKFRVEFGGGTELDPAANSPHFCELLNNVVINSEIIPLSGADIPDNVENDRSDIIIVTHSDYGTAANTMAEWKRQMGYTVEVVSQSSWTSAQVKAAIHDRYAAWTPKPDYFVIIGDHDDVPAEASTLLTLHVTDLYYACMDGPTDYYPDMAHGRISVSGVTEANDVIDKIVDYECDPSSTTSFYTHGTTCAMFQDRYDPPHTYKDGYADRRFAHTSEEIRDHLISNGYTIDRIYDLEDDTVNPTNWNDGYYSNGEPIPAGLLKPGFAWDGDTTDIISSVDDGRFLLFHRDHGYSGGSGWAHPRFTTGNIPSLSNGDWLPVVFSINCHTGEFDLPECFAEKFLRYDGNDKGAVGVFAASNASVSGNNDGLAEGFIDAIWPGLVPLFPHNPTPVVTPHDPMYAMGDVLNQGKIRMTETWGSSSPPHDYSQYTFELFHYFGDPTMKIWTAVPQTITATYEDHVDVGQTSFDISGASCGTGIATLYYDGEIIGKCTLASGACTIPLSPSPSTPGTDTVLLTITSHNCRPLRDLLDVISVGDSITNIELTPPSPAWLDFNEHVDITFDYSTNEAGGVRIFVRPYTGGSLTPNYAAHGSPLYPYPGGSGNGYFTITSGAVTVDQLRFRMLNADQSVLLLEFFIDVDYHFGEEPECKVLFDASHDTDGDDTIDDGYYDFAETMRAEGYGVNQLTTGPITSELLEDYCALVLCDPEIAFTNAEVNAILAFVEDGGGLFVLGECNDLQNVNTNLNQVINAVGIDLNSDLIKDDTDNHAGTNGWPLIHEFAPHAVTSGLVNLWYIAGCSMDVEVPAYELGWGDDDSYVTYSSSLAGSDESNVEGITKPISETETDRSSQRGKTIPTPPAGEVDTEGNLVNFDGWNRAALKQDEEASISLNILHYGPSTEPPRLTALGATVTHITDPSVISEAYLNQFDVFYVGYGAERDYGSLTSKAAAIQNYISGGGGVILEQPSETGYQCQFLPAGFGVIVYSTQWPGYPTYQDPLEFTSAGTTHPMLQGLTPDDLSGNFDTVYDSDLGGSYTRLARLVSYPTMIALAAGQHGNGRIVFHTGNINAGSSDPGSDTYVEQMLEWAASGGGVENPIAVAASEYGDGRVVAVGDSNLICSTDADKDNTPDIYQYDAEQFAINVIKWLCPCEVSKLDWGDAPDSVSVPVYPTLMIHNGARHVIAGPWLGDRTDNPDAEPDGQPDPNAMGDDNDGNDDEDGVVFNTPLVPGQPAQVTVTASGSGLLQGWIDFGANGNWADPGEQIFADQSLVTGPTVLTFNVPSTAAIGPTFARFRFSTVQGLPFYGPARDGEVEDYEVRIGHEPMCGDVTGNGAVNFGDVILLRNHVKNPAGYPLSSEWAGDVTGNGEINFGDVILLRNHVKNPAGYPLNCAPRVRS